MNILPTTGFQGMPPPAAAVAPTNHEPTAVAQRTAVSNAEQPQQAQPVGREQTEEAVKRIKEFVQPINDSIQFSLDDDTGFTVVKVIDLQTKEVLRQIPSEEAINIAKALDKLKGLLIHSKA